MLPRLYRYLKLFETNKFPICLCATQCACGRACVCASDRIQDYLGGVILFAAIVTALFAAKIYSNTTSPSLVALAINYTLLVPIYLNWVVKLSSDLESYIGAVERISHYIDDAPNEQHEEKKCKSMMHRMFCFKWIRDELSQMRRHQ